MKCEELLIANTDWQFSTKLKVIFDSDLSIIEEFTFSELLFGFSDGKKYSNYEVVCFGSDHIILKEI